MKKFGIHAKQQSDRIAGYDLFSRRRETGMRLPFTLLPDEEGKETGNFPICRPGAISFCLNPEFHAKIAG